MRNLTFLKTVQALLLFCACTTLAAQEAVLVDELEAFYPDRTVEKRTTVLSGDTPRGVPAAVHVLITGLPPGGAVTVRLKEDGAPVVGVATYRLIPIPVEQNTGLTSRTEIFEAVLKSPHPSGWSLGSCTGSSSPGCPSPVAMSSA